MPRPHSLERRLLVWILGALSLGALLLVLVSYLVTLDEMGEAFDDNLRQVALAVAARSGASASTEVPQAPTLFEEHGDFDFTTAVWDRGGHLLSLSGSGSAPPFSDVPGLSHSGGGEDAWHIYSIVIGDRVVQAAQRGSARESLAAESASKLLAPVIALTLLIGALLVVALRRGLRPLDAAASDVAARSAVSLDPIDTGGVPSEIHPLIHALNGLMQRLAEAFGVQRQFVADAAHELRSPITALRLQLQLLERVRDDAQRHAAIDDLKLGVERAQRLIAQLLDLSRVEPDAPAPRRQRVDLALLVQQAVVRHSPAAERKGIDLGADIGSAPVYVDADPQQIDVLLDNLIGNAIRYTPSGGRIDAVAQLQADRPALLVRDTGPGIDLAERDRVFDRFYRGEAGQNDKAGPGSGLGLAIVDAIAKRHRARVRLESPASGGLEARVEFETVPSAA